MDCVVVGIDGDGDGGDDFVDVVLGVVAVVVFSSAFVVRVLGKLENFESCFQRVSCNQERSLCH